MELEIHKKTLEIISMPISFNTERNESVWYILPPVSPVAFVPRKFKSFVESKGGIDKQAWERALLTVFRDEIKSGNLLVTHSKCFGNFDDFFITMT